MATTKTSIISNSVTLLGNSPITTLDNANDLVTAAEQAFDMLLPSVLSNNNWRFAVQIQQLSKTLETPPTESLYSAVYLLPAGFLKTIRVYPHNYNWEIFENKKIYTTFNSDTPFLMEYVFQPDISLLPPYFVNYFVFEIAAYLALSNAQKPEYYNVLEAKRIALQGSAAASDAQNRPNNTFANFPVLTNRNIESHITF
jgi:hypothetical protein